MKNEDKYKIEEKLLDQELIIKQIINVSSIQNYVIKMYAEVLSNTIKHLSNLNISDEDIAKISNLLLKIKELEKIYFQTINDAENTYKRIKNNDVKKIIKPFYHKNSLNKVIVGHYTRKQFGELTRLLFNEELPKYCENCHSTSKLHIHHKVYRLPLVREDLQRLCFRCHILVHNKKLKKEV